MKRLIIVACCLGAVSCASVPKDPAQDVYALKATLSGLLVTANAYAALPMCPQNAPVCSDPLTLEGLIRPATDAQTTLATAEQAVNQGQSAAVVTSEITLAQAAIADLQTAIAPAQRVVAQSKR